MLFVKPRFFEFEPVKISNITGTGSIANDFARFIGIHEKQCLISILGACLHKELMDSFTFENGIFTLKTDATTPIKNLVNGLEYDAPAIEDYVSFPKQRGCYTQSFGCGCGCGQDGCTKRYWKGIVQKDEFVVGNAKAESERSFLADYVYYQHLLINRTITTGSGQKVVEGENSTPAQNFSKRVDRYNEFIKAVIGGNAGETPLYRFLHENKADYPTWVRNCNLEFIPKF